MSTPDLNAKSEVLQKFLDEVSEQLGRSSGFVQRKSKLQGATFAKTLILGWLSNGAASLNELTQISEELGVSISAAGLSQRMNTAAVSFLAQLLHEGLACLYSEARLPANLLADFSAVNIVDSTILTLPARLCGTFAGCGGTGSTAAVKVHLNFDYLHGTFTALEVVAGRSPDQNCALTMQQAQPKSLSIFDLGFFKQDLLTDITATEAYFVCRFQPQTAVFVDEHGQHPLDLFDYLRRQAAVQGELCVYLGRVSRLKVRLVFQKMSAEVIAQRHRRAKRAAGKKGKTCSADQLAWLAWSIFITTVPDSIWSTQEVPLIYSLRWQIELLFKLFKSQACLDFVPPCRPQRLLCQLYAHLLGVLIFQWLAAPYRWFAQRELSLPKAFRLFQRYAVPLGQAIGSPTHLWAVLVRLIEDFQRFALKDKRKKSPSSLARLLLACP